MRMYLLAASLLAVLSGCAVRASVPGASFALATGPPVVVDRPFYRGAPRYVVEDQRRYARPRRFRSWDDDRFRRRY
jgi:hypothetical protein